VDLGERGVGACDHGFSRPLTRRFAPPSPTRERLGGEI
jgi:hypothetical protein